MHTVPARILAGGGGAHLKHVDRLRTGYFHLGRDDGNLDVMDVGHGDPRRGGPPESLEREHSRSPTAQILVQNRAGKFAK